MQNRKIRHLLLRTSSGRYYVPTDLHTPINLELLSENNLGLRAFDRLGNRNAGKYIKSLIKGTPIKFQ